MNYFDCFYLVFRLSTKQSSCCNILYNQCNGSTVGICLEKWYAMRRIFYHTVFAMHLLGVNVCMWLIPFMGKCNASCSLDCSCFSSIFSSIFPFNSVVRPCHQVSSWEIANEWISWVLSCHFVAQGNSIAYRVAMEYGHFGHSNDYAASIRIGFLQSLH